MKADHPLRRPAAFLVVGVSATLVYTVVSSLLVSMASMAPVPAGFIAYVAVVPPTYLAQKTLTFRAKTAHRTSFLRYATLQLFGLATTTLANSLFAAVAPDFHTVFFFISAMAAAGFNFIIMRAWVFAGADTANS